MRKIFYLLLLLSSLLSAQQIRNWQNYTNMQSINSIDFSEGIIWAATNGGVFNFYQSDSSYFTLTKSEGISSHTTSAIAIANNGNIWIGTSEGYLNVYEPETNQTNTIFSISKTNESNKRINEIRISNDTAFVSTEFGLILFNTKDYSVFDSILKFGEFSTKSPVKNVTLGRKIYVVTQSGIAFSKPGIDNLQAPDAWENISFPNSNQINKIIFNNGILYAATTSGIYKFENNVWSLEYLSGFNISDFVVIGSDIFCIVGIFNNNTKELEESRIYRNNTGSELFFSSGTSLLYKIYYNTDGKIYLASSKGILSIDGVNQKLLFPRRPSTNSIIDLSVDSEGNLWAATGKDGRGVGVLKFDGENWSTIGVGTSPSFKLNDFHKVYSSETATYFSNWGRGFIKYKDGIYTNFDFDDSGIQGTIKNNDFVVINGVYEDNNGNAWVVNYEAADKKSIMALTPENIIYKYQFASPLSAQFVNLNELVVDQYNTKWFTGFYDGDITTDGLYYFNENGTFDNLNDDTWGRLTKSNGLRNSSINALAIDQLGELIIGTITGVDVISDPSNPGFIRSDQYFSMRQQTINCIMVDPINQKWFGTENGVFLTSSDGSNLIANFTKANSPLPSDNITSIAIDKKSGIVYVGSEFGVTAISTLFIEPNLNFSDLYVYPNPMTVSSSSENNIVIDGLIEASEIKILDISGNLINEFRSIGGKMTNWDCKNFNGQLVSSGIYIIVAFDSEVNEIGHAKLAVIRN
ncbi:MAG: hypothetical protein OQJ81_11055 [Melioribacteraceae bacterium]|nr:hypothetical protein [Melioribacteraceae bacterium]